MVQERIFPQHLIAFQESSHVNLSGPTLHDSASAAAPPHRFMRPATDAPCAPASLVAALRTSTYLCEQYVRSVITPLFGWLWETCLFPVVPSSSQVDGYFYGRGTSDNKGPILAFIYAVKELLEDCKAPGAGCLPVNVAFLLEGERGSGSIMGRALAAGWGLLLRTIAAPSLACAALRSAAFP